MPVKTTVTNSLEKMLEAGVHFGHQKSKWQPKMRPYIYTMRHNVHIIDLEKTEKKLESAKKFLKRIASKNGIILFIGTKKQAKKIIKETADKLSQPSVTERWLGGTFTNFKTIHLLLEKLSELKAEEQTDTAQKITKLDQFRKTQAIMRLEKKIGGIASLKKLPDAIFILDPKEEKSAVKEARAMGIPIVSMVDTNNDPSLVDYPIPANNDSLKSIDLILKELVKAIKSGQKQIPTNGR